MMKKIFILLFLVAVLTLVSFNVSFAQDTVEWNSQYFRNADETASASWVSKPVDKDSVVTKISVTITGFPTSNRPAGDAALFIKRAEEPYYYEFMIGGFSELIVNHVNRVAQGPQTSSSDWSWEASPNLFVPQGSEISCHSTLWPGLGVFPESFGSFDCKVTLDSPAGKTVTRSLRFPYIDQKSKPVSDQSVSVSAVSGQSPWVGYKSNNDFPLKVKNADFFVSFPHLVRAGLNFCVYWVKNGEIYQQKCIPYQQKEANLNYDGYRQLLDINWDIPPGDELFAQCTYYGAAGSNGDCAAYVFVELPNDKRNYQGLFTSYDLIDVSKAHDYCYDPFNSEWWSSKIPYFATNSSEKCMDLLRLYDPVEVTLSSDKSQGSVGETIKLTAQNKRGLNPQYKFWYYDGTNYLMLRDWGVENSFTTTIKKQGINQYGVHIKDTGRDYGSEWPDIWVVAQSWIEVNGSQCSNEGEFCRKVGIKCCTGLKCQFGRCVKEVSKPYVCEAIKPLSGTQSDASTVIQKCIDDAPTDAIVEIPPGKYYIAKRLNINKPLTFRTQEKNESMPRCALENHDCAELVASEDLYEYGGILAAGFTTASSTGVTVDHLVFNGNKIARANSPAGQQCSSGINTYGGNVLLTGSNVKFINSVSKNALCATALGVAHPVSGASKNEYIEISRNTIAFNGIHEKQLWSDGVTVLDAANSLITDNEIIDNSDVDLIFGGCTNCVIQNNKITHTTDSRQGSFAALIIHAWSTTSGDYTNTVFSNNFIDCGTQKRCGFGLLIGSDAWYKSDPYGGSVHDNLIRNVQQSFSIDDAHDMEVYNNKVELSGSETITACGIKKTVPYSIGSRSYKIDTSKDNPPVTYSRIDWDDCIPNNCQDGVQEGEFCGGIVGVKCCLGLKCQLDGTYPDAGGKCVKETSKCADSDGGKDYYTKGTVTLGKESKTDSCTYCTGTCLEIGKCPEPVCGGVVEYYCDNNIIKSEEYVCPNNCEEGACLQADHCDSGVQDGDEEGVDCGGSCQACKECGTDMDCPQIECITTPCPGYKCVDGECVLLGQPVCNKDNVCELAKNEDSTNCPEDCYCSDGICDQAESREECPKDCKYCTSEWECQIEPATCPEEGIQNKVCIDTKCGTETKRAEALKCVPGTCSGCLSEGTCYPVTTRKVLDNVPSYCEVTKTFYKQKDLGAPCQNNYECLSNECSDGECISLKKELEETQSLLQKILGWLNNIF